MKKGRDLLKSIRTTSLFAATTTTAAVENGAALTLKIMDEQFQSEQRYCYKPSLRWNPLLEDYFIKAYGPHHFSRISKALTRPSCYSCIRVNTLKTTSDAVIEKLLEILQETGNSDICSEASIGISESVSPLKASLQSCPVVKCQLPGLEEYVVFVRGSGPHAIQYDYKEDKPPKEVIVSRKCAEAVLRGAQVYVPGVLACSAHVEKGDVVAVSVAVEQPGPDGGWGTGITRGIVLQGLETDPHYFERNGLYIGRGTAMLSRAGIFRVLQGLAVDMTSRVFTLPSFNNVLEGEIFLQNLPSIIAAYALDPQQGERILDMCAAPGGKTTAIAILMKDKGEVVACDRSHNKVLDIQKLAAEMGLNCISTYKLDALKSVHRKSESKDMTTRCSSGDILDLSIQTPDLLKSEMEKMSSVPIENLDGYPTCGENVGGGEREKKETYSSKAEMRKKIRRMKNGPGRSHSAGARVDISQGFSPNSFDRVLLDAPCSALGLRPRLFAGVETLESLRNHSRYQRKMFDQAVQLVRPGGVIVYSTCTINPGENEALVRYALNTYKFLSLASQHPKVGGPGLVGRFESTDGYIEEWLRPGEEDLVQRFDPSSPLDTIGFFVAKFSVGPKDLSVEKI